MRHTLLFLLVTLFCSSVAANSPDHPPPAQETTPGYAQERAERQQERQQQRVDRRVERETDDAVDRTVDRALDRFFRR